MDDYVCPRPPTIVKRKKSVSRISGCSSHHEKRLSSSLFSENDFEEFARNDDDDDDMDMLFHDSMDLSPPPIRLALHEPPHGLDFGISPTSVMDTMFDPFMMNKNKDHKQNLPSVPDLTRSYSSESSSSSDWSTASPPGTPKRNRHRIQKWSSFHEDGRDWGTSKACAPSVTRELFHLLAMMEEQDGCSDDE